MRIYALIGCAALFGGSYQVLIVTGNFDVGSFNIAKQSGAEKTITSHPCIKCKPDLNSEECLGVTILSIDLPEEVQSQKIQSTHYKEFGEIIKKNHKSKKEPHAKNSCIILLIPDKAKMKWAELIELTDPSLIFITAVTRIIHGFLLSKELGSISEGDLSNIQSFVENLVDVIFEFDDFKQYFVQYCIQSPIPQDYLSMLQSECHKRGCNEYYWRFRLELLTKITYFLPKHAFYDPEPGFITLYSGQYPHAELGNQEAEMQYALVLKAFERLTPSIGSLKDKAEHAFESLPSKLEIIECADLLKDKAEHAFKALPSKSQVARYMQLLEHRTKYAASVIKAKIC